MIRCICYFAFTARCPNWETWQAISSGKVTRNHCNWIARVKIISHRSSILRRLISFLNSFRFRFRRTGLILNSWPIQLLCTLCTIHFVHWHADIIGQLTTAFRIRSIKVPFIRLRPPFPATRARRRTQRTELNRERKNLWMEMKQCHLFPCPTMRSLLHSVPSLSILCHSQTTKHFYRFQYFYVLHFDQLFHFYLWRSQLFSLASLFNEKMVCFIVVVSCSRNSSILRPKSVFPVCTVSWRKKRNVRSSALYIN